MTLFCFHSESHCTSKLPETLVIPDVKVQYNISPPNTSYKDV